MSSRGELGAAVTTCYIEDGIERPFTRATLARWHCHSKSGGAVVAARDFSLKAKFLPI